MIKQDISKDMDSTQLKRKSPSSTPPSEVFPDLIEIDSDSEDESNINKTNDNDDTFIERRSSFSEDSFVDDNRELVDASYKNAGIVSNVTTAAVTASSNVARKQFWKAGDYDASCVLGAHPSTSSYSAGMDHVRVHPRFLHSNATSHKWALGAFAELLDNALDEVNNGATYVKIDMLINEKDRSKMLLADIDRHRMLLVQDNGGGMDPNKMRQCMSLGYSAKSKLANTIGQYGNGFKTSTMRLGADVIVFSMCQGKDGTCPTRSVGMLSYTFLTSTGKEDIIVPMIDYEKKGEVWTKIVRSSLENWHVNLEAVVQWSPFSSEQDLLQQFDSIGYQGTRIIIYNLWEDDRGQLELDFGTDPHDIQIRGVNRDEKRIAMARKYPNSKHFLTYQHSLRSYASILYLRIPTGFRIILRGQDVMHHELVNDMIHPKQVSYKPMPITNGTVKDSALQSENMQALVTLGFVKDAQDHMDIQGFNVYHKNRLIKPFWRVWNAAGSDGRGVIGVLEANFVEPAHDKQGFERTTALSRLESRLVHLQKTYWRDNCHEIGYAPRRSINKVVPIVSSPLPIRGNGNAIKGMTPNRSDDNALEIIRNSSKRNSVKKIEHISPNVESLSEDDEMTNNHIELPSPTIQHNLSSSNKVEQINNDKHTSTEMKAEVEMLRKENLELIQRLEKATESRDDSLRELQFERDRSRALEAQFEEANRKNAEMDKEQEALITIFAEERERRDTEDEKMRERLRAASKTIDELVEKVHTMEKYRQLPRCKPEID
ncbi:protein MICRORCHIDIA 7-like [Chenopodium quinoa]|uniref:protein MICRORCHIDIA 7-like n=1 Tax=Chenopodium quinoa TaxID=63459 RepID=UPI000B787A25|nr:protein MICRORCHIDIA 7-like [Chenopodium quinoa]